MAKHWIAGALVLAIIAASAPAQAGIAVGALTKTGRPATWIGLGVGVAASVVVTAGKASEARDVYKTWITLGLPTLIVITLLDAQDSSEATSLREFYQQAYPFVESEEAISRLADATQAKIDAENGIGVTLRSVHFSREELTPIFESTSVSAADFDRIAAELQ